MGHKLINFLLTRNKEQSRLFWRKGPARRKYRKNHPTEICVLKCMDGRLHLPTFTETPVGILQPYRNIGGKFDFGWPWFGFLIRKWVEYSIGKSRDCLILISYHFSKGDPHRGCAGFKYDTEAAKAHTSALVRQAERIFEHDIAYPVQIGVETDDEALIVHGSNGGVLDLGVETNLSAEELTEKITKLFPDMEEQVVADFCELLLGNLRHIKKIRESNRPILEMVHGEQILAIGRGFDWLHLPNKAIIIGPYDPNLSEPIEVAARLLLENIEKKRIPEGEGVVIITSSVYDKKPTLEFRQAIEKSITLAQLALKVIDERVPELKKYMASEPLIGVVDYNNREFLRINPETYEPYE
jgi:hypothetical protein